MDLFKIIDQLYKEKKRLDRVIQALEEVARVKHPGAGKLSRGGGRRTSPAAATSSGVHGVQPPPDGGKGR